MSSLGGLLEGGIIGLAVSEAASTVVEPALEPSRQEAESKVKARIHDLDALATAVAQALLSLEDVTEDAHRNGFPDDGLTLAVQLALRAPGVAEALTLYRRRNMQEGGAPFPLSLLHHAYAKAQIEYQYWDALDSLATLPLDPAVIANLIVRGIMPAPFALPYTPPSGTGNVEAFPESTLDAAREAAASGVDVDRLFGMVAAIGRPMGPVEAAQAFFRGILTDDDYLRAILEGDTRGEWATAIRERAREILSATQYAESRLRGYTATDEEMFANIAKHGMSQDDAELLFLNQGRPLAIHQVTTGEARGGVYNGPTDQIPPAYLDAVRESNIKPPYYNLDYANRYTYPTGFMIKAEATNGDIPQPDCEQLLLELGWSPKWAAFFSEKWAAQAAKSGTAGGVAAAPVVKSQTTAAVTALRKAYVGGALDRPTAQAFLAQLDKSAAEQAAILAIWDINRQIEGTTFDTTGGTPH